MIIALANKSLATLGWTLSSGSVMISALNDYSKPLLKIEVSLFLLKFTTQAIEMTGFPYIKNINSQLSSANFGYYSDRSATIVLL